jgi:SAM-dependent methyltransferase
MKYQLEPDYWAHAKRLDFIRKHIAEGDTILDLACGTGILVAFPLAELGYAVDGVDIDEKSIAGAVAENPFPNLSFICSDFNDYYPGKRYDVVIAAEVMEHLKEPETILRAIDRLLALDGTAIITFPNGYGLHEVEEIVYHNLFEPWGFVPKIRYFNQSVWTILGMCKGHKMQWPKYNPPPKGLEMTANVACGHAIHLTQKWFRQLCDDAGYEIVDQQPGSLFHGQISGHIMCNFKSLIVFNSGVVEFLPMWMASRWFFAIRRKER